MVRPFRFGLQLRDLGVLNTLVGAARDGIPLRRPGPRVRRFAESLGVLRTLLDHGSATIGGRFHHLALDDLGVRPVQSHVPFLIGGHGRQLVGTAGRFADIFQFTGLTHGDGGAPAPGGFRLADVLRRGEWLEEAAGDRSALIERSALVQVTHVGSGAEAALDELTTSFEVDRALLDETPFILAGTLEQVVDKVERLRATAGISHFVVREAEGFAPLVAALAGR